MTITKRITAALLTLAMLGALTACNTAKPAESAAAVETTAAPETTAPPVDPIDSMIDQMTLEEKVGQLFYACAYNENTPTWVAEYHLGGVILFGNSFAEKTADEIRADIDSYQKSASVPLLVGVDEEGGTVVRISDNPNLRDEAFPSPKEVYANGGWDAIEGTETEKAELLRSLGVNVNMAPVCDVTGNEESFMYDRSFSGDADEVCTFVTKTVTICKDKQLGTVLKHFPGYGDNTDTHEDMAYDSKSYAEFQQTDFRPFQAGIDAGADCVLVAHNIVESIDSEAPASLSAKAHEILRSELHFDGVIMTDDLAMQAIAKYAGADTAAVAAVKCGNDLLCCSAVDTEYPAVLAAVKSGDIPEAQIDASVKRVLQWKEKLGLLTP